MTKTQQKERGDAIAQLREWIKPGDTVYTILAHVSASNMSRAIRVVVPYLRPEERREVARHTAETCPGRPCGAACDHVEYAITPATVDHLHPNRAVGKALGLRHWKRSGHEQEALVLGGYGMDMGFHLVYELSQTLYGSGYDCIGEHCPSNVHVNDRQSPRGAGVRHTDGYALRHRWL